MQVDDRTVAHVVARVSQLGLTVDEPHVLGMRANLVLHLKPAPVVARVATLTAEMRQNPADYLRREREVTTALSELGVDVIAPTTLVDPGPHNANGFWFLLMTYRELEPVDLRSAHDAEAVGRSLADLEYGLAELPDLGLGGVGTADRGHPWAEINRLTTTVEPTTEPKAMARIVEAIEVLKATEPEDRWRLVHGDAHRVNVAFDGDQAVWFDFEDTNDRPLAWDLATLRRAWPAAGDVACRHLGVDPSNFSMTWHHELREIYALLWNLLYAQRDEQAGPATQERLAGWLTRTPLSERSVSRSE